MAKKILILSVSAGAGHTQAANAMEQTIKLNHPEVVVEHLDLMEIVPKPFKKFYVDGYLKLIDNYPQLWRSLFEKTDVPDDNFFSQFRILFENLNTKKLKKHVQNFEPDEIICTHFLAAQALKSLKEKQSIKFNLSVIVTDYDVHQLWVYPFVDTYFVAGHLAYLRLIEKGVEQDKIYITGIPVRPSFYNIFNNEEIAQQFGLDSKKNTVLIMAGGAGIGNLEELTQLVLDSSSQTQVLTLCGKNQKTFDKINKLREKFPHCHPIGFTNEVAKLMHFSQLVITKPGGLSTTECVTLKKPMLLISPIPGQEEINANYFMSKGIASLALNSLQIKNCLYELMECNDIQRMQSNYLNTPFFKENSAKEILNIIL
jgi:processive 1,2-diacylglycerol beta-glucosyltransferase